MLKAFLKVKLRPWAKTNKSSLIRKEMARLLYLNVEYRNFSFLLLNGIKFGVTAENFSLCSELPGKSQAVNIFFTVQLYLMF